MRNIHAINIYDYSKYIPQWPASSAWSTSLVKPSKSDNGFLEMYKTAKDVSWLMEAMFTIFSILLSVRSSLRSFFNPRRSFGKKVSWFLARFRYCNSVNRLISTVISVNKLFDKSRCSTYYRNIHLYKYKLFFTPDYKITPSKWII